MSVHAIPAFEWWRVSCRKSRRSIEIDLAFKIKCVNIGYPMIFTPNLPPATHPLQTRSLPYQLSLLRSSSRLLRGTNRYLWTREIKYFHLRLGYTLLVNPTSHADLHTSSWLNKGPFICAIIIADILTALSTPRSWMPPSFYSLSKHVNDFEWPTARGTYCHFRFQTSP